MVRRIFNVNNERGRGGGEGWQGVSSYYHKYATCVCHGNYIILDKVCGEGMVSESGGTRRGLWFYSFLQLHNFVHMSVLRLIETRSIYIVCE